MNRPRIQRLAGLIAALALLCGSPARAGVGDALRTWTLRGVGAITGLALHEACHLGVGRAMGARLGTRPDPDSVLPIRRSFIN